MPDGSETWDMIHAQRADVADMLETLTPDQWAAPSLCSGWTVHVAAAHILAGAEQTPPAFMKKMAASGFRFNTMIDRDARRLGALPPAEIIERLRARTSTTNGPPAPAMTMLGEIVVHGEDVRQPLGLPSAIKGDAALACLEMFKKTIFPVSGRKRVAGLRLEATDVDWAFGDGPEVTGPASSLLLAMTGRTDGLVGLTGDGVAIMRRRIGR